MAFSRDRIVGVCERLLNGSELRRFVLVRSWRRTPEPGFVCMPYARFTCVLDGVFNIAVGNGNRLETLELGPGDVLVMQPFCLTGSVSEHSCELFGCVRRRGYMRLIHSAPTSGGVRSPEPSDFYHLGDTVRRCTARQLDSFLEVGSEAELNALGPEMLHAYFSMLVRDLRNSTPPDPGRANLLWMRISSYLDDNFGEETTRSEVARRFGVSESYVSRLFHRNSGVSFVEYLRRVRISHAREMLRATPMSVNGIATACGFGSGSYFIRCFRAEEGMSPGTMRKLK